MSCMSFPLSLTSFQGDALLFLLYPLLLLLARNAPVLGSVIATHDGCNLPRSGSPFQPSYILRARRITTGIMLIRQSEQIGRFPNSPVDQHQPQITHRQRRWIVAGILSVALSCMVVVVVGVVVVVAATMSRTCSGVRNGMTCLQKIRSLGRTAWPMMILQHS